MLVLLFNAEPQLLKIKCTSLFLLLCLVAPLAATFTLLHYQKRQVREAVKRQILAGVDQKELVLLKFTKKETEAHLRWEHDREFEYQGQMYDVVETIVKRDSIYYRCWWDHAETKLNKQLDELLASVLSADPQRNERQKRLFHFYQSLICSQPPVLAPLPPCEGKRTFHYRFSCHLIFHPPPVPPPQMG